MDSAKYAELYLTESQEHLSAINQWLLALEDGGDTAAAVDAVFRSVHTVKGMSATMGYTSVANLAHEMESTLERVRQGQTAVSADLMDVLFRAADVLEAQIQQLVVTGGADAGDASEGAHDDVANVVTRLHAFGVDGKDATKRGKDKAKRRSNVSARHSKPMRDEHAGRLVRVRLAADTPLPGVRAFMVVEAARKVGTVTETRPPLGTLQDGAFDGEFELRVITNASVRDLERALRSAGDVDRVVVDGSEGAIQELESGLPPAAPARAAKGQTGRAPQHVRVDLRRLDSLMNLVGELVITRGRLADIASAVGDAALNDSVAQASRLIGDLRDEIVSSRMVPVWQVFDRFPRLVRDAARTLGKQIEFIIEGKEIELDRSMLDEIGDSIVHLLRNAVDHGIELPDERLAVGKPMAGRLVLSAARDRAAVVIKVSDDGRGIDRDRVLARAKHDGLVDVAKTELTDDDLVRLVARPGFSTAERVTDLSGRGVGVDAVYTRVRSLGGTVDIRSIPGQSTTVLLRLPLTLAIVRALLARADRETYAIPLTHVSETVELTEDACRTLRGREVLMLRDEVLPLLRLRALVGLGETARRADGERVGQVAGSFAPDADQAEHVVIIDLGDRRAGLVVDELTGQQEIVVKQFDATRPCSPIFGGATILGDGMPALIVDVGSLL